MAGEAVAAPDDVLAFWFGELTPPAWFAVDPALDVLVRQRFLQTHLTLAAGVPDDWRRTPESVLAAVIVLDQFPRNMFRGTPHAFATDCLALALANEAVASGFDKAIKPERRAFVYLPFEHAEDMVMQETSVRLFTDLGEKQPLDYAIRHRDVIARFGRFPHRNRILERESTAGELAYLAEPGAGF